MVDQELVERVTRLPVPARLELIELLTHSLRQELAPEQMHTTDDPVAIVNRLFGILRTDGTVPTDEEIREEYTDYLSRKYA
ncbi:MAG: hypothetical protein IPO81_29385 [Kouleothrix sp.]|nr:hypothetical protein [Kouleothrix sp.]